MRWEPALTEITPSRSACTSRGTPTEVFGFFTYSARYVQWMGSEAELEPVPGGVPRAHAGRVRRVTLRHENLPDLVEHRLWSGNAAKSSRAFSAAENRRT